MRLRAFENEADQEQLRNRLGILGNLVGDAAKISQDSNVALEHSWDDVLHDQELNEQDIRKLQNLVLSSEIEDVDALWDSLSAENKRAFRRAVASGQLSNALGITAWTPWWLDPLEKHISCVKMHEHGKRFLASIVSSEKASGITDAREAEKDQDPNRLDAVEEAATGLRRVRKLRNNQEFPPCVRLLCTNWNIAAKIPMDLTRVSPTLQSNLLDLLLAYALTLRYHAGSVFTDACYKWHSGIDPEGDEVISRAIPSTTGKHSSSPSSGVTLPSSSGTAKHREIGISLIEREDPLSIVELSQFLVQASSVLYRDARFTAPDAVFSAFFFNVINQPALHVVYTSTNLEERTKFNISIVRDIVYLASSGHFVKDALYHIGAILRAGMNTAKCLQSSAKAQGSVQLSGKNAVASGNVDVNVDLMKTLQLAFKKVQFYISWAEKTFLEREDIHITINRIEQGLANGEDILSLIRVAGMEFIHSSMKVTGTS